jgi:predicted short-subunit dehydrogenase-like oxidoreductase (DUF2520 family)
MPRPRIVIVGFGRVGGALSFALRKAGYAVAALPRSGGSVRAATKARIPLAELETLARANLCFLTVPDRAVPEVAEQLEPDLGPRTAVIHCAGALTLDVFGAKRPRGSFHPLCAVSSRTDSLSGSSVALAASSPALLRTLRTLARDIELRPFEVKESGRASYHAGAMLAAGGLVALASTAADCFRAAGVPEGEALTALIPLMRSAISGLELRGLPDALTGPVARGDISTLARHLTAIPVEARATYLALVERSAALVEKELSADVRAQLDRLLRTAKR